eukprot:GHVS01091551.1.p1 GENE.GHVS01091551.1~~GHVS01091551.1.p1  ORF type:complete len:146 (+),score=16.52 GHVS01091551.1:56-493(+)
MMHTSKSGCVSIQQQHNAYTIYIYILFSSLNVVGKKLTELLILKQQEVETTERRRTALLLLRSRHFDVLSLVCRLLLPDHSLVSIVAGVCLLLLRLFLLMCFFEFVELLMELSDKIIINIFVIPARGVPSAVPVSSHLRVYGPIG